MERLYVSIADTPYKQAQGLMFVKTLDPDRGMLFSFSKEQKLKFWGENTFIPLDIAFVDAKGVIRKIAYIVPLSNKVVASDDLCKYAIEANSGYFAEKRIEAGDSIQIHQNGPHGHVEFLKERRNTIRTSRTAFNRRILAQLMSEDYAYDEQQPVQPTQQQQDPNIPVIRQEDLWKYLEDSFHEPQQKIDPDQMQQQEDIGDYPLELDQVTEPEQDYPMFEDGPDEDGRLKSKQEKASDYAEENSEVMRISYTTQHGAGIERDVEPHGIFQAETTGNRILVTWDQTVGDIRAYILENIKTFAFKGERFEPKFKIV